MLHNPTLFSKWQREAEDKEAHSKKVRKNILVYYLNMIVSLSFPEMEEEILLFYPHYPCIPDLNLREYQSGTDYLQWAQGLS